MLHTNTYQPDDCRNQLKACKDSLEYLNDLLRFHHGFMEEWEKKEYNLQRIDCIREINRLESHIAKHPNIFKTSN